MGELRLYEQVRVVRLLHPPEPDGVDIWLGDFLAEEIEPVGPEAA